MSTKPATTPTINTNTGVASTYLDPKNAGPFALTVMVFVLYVMCFISLYNPHLELIGYGLFFVLHMIMSGGIIKSGLDNTNTIDINKISITVPPDLWNIYQVCFNIFLLLFIIFGLPSLLHYYTYKRNHKNQTGGIVAAIVFLFLFIVGILISLGIEIFSSTASNMHIIEYIFNPIHDSTSNPPLNINQDILNVFKHITNYWMVVKTGATATTQNNVFVYIFKQIIQGVFVVISGIIGFILLTILFFLLFGLFLETLPFKVILLLGKPFGLFSTIPISWSIMIGLLFLFISFIMLLITFVKVHAKHSAMNAPTMPKFLAGGNGVVKSGYTFKEGPQGTGYYLIDGVDFLFNDKKTQKNVSNFKIISITTTVLIWVQYLANKMVNRETIQNSPIINGMFALNGITIVSLSSVCIWLTQQIGVRTGAIRGPPTTKDIEWLKRDEGNERGKQKEREKKWKRQEGAQARQFYSENERRKQLDRDRNENLYHPKTA